MLIYSHNTPEKLLPVAISKDYIRDNTDLCDLVDDPDIGIDVDFAINYRKALTGDPQSIETFIDSLILSGYALDAYTLDYYVTRVQTNPILRYYIQGSVNKSSNFTIRDCLNSPCNYFAPISNNIGVLGDVASTLNYNTIPTLSLSAIPAAFSMSMATLNKIPKSIQEAVGELTQLTTDTFKTVINIFNDDPEKVKAQEDAIKSGLSYRSSSVGDIYTSDYRHYLDISVAASDLLGGIANTMGNCFKLYQYRHRYNPFDYEMNQTGANRQGIVRKVGTNYAATGYNGTNMSNEGDLFRSGNDYTTLPGGGIDATPIRGDLVGTIKKMAVTLFGGYYDEQNKILYSTSWTDVGSSKAYTDAGIVSNPKYRVTPGLERILVDKLKNGWREIAAPLPKQQGKFNMGFAIGKLAVIEYFKSVGVDTNIASKTWAKTELEAIVKLNGVTYRLPQIDKGPDFEQTRGGSSTRYRVLDITLNAGVQLFGLNVDGKKKFAGSVDTDYVETVVNAVHNGSNTVQKGLAEVQLIIPGVYEPGTTPSPSPFSSLGDATSGDPTRPPLPVGDGMLDFNVLPPRDSSDDVEELVINL